MHVGLVGAGRIGSFHARTLAAIKAVEILTIADTDPVLAQALAAELGKKALVAPSAEQLLDDGVDAVAIASPTPTHAPLIERAAQAGIATFCEKPIALDLPTTARALAAVHGSGTYLQIGFQRRFDPGFAAAQATVASGDVGTLLLVRGCTHDPAPPSPSYVEGSGGIYRDLHIHDFDAVRFVTGEEVVEVTAAGAVLQDEWIAGYDDVDVSALTMRLAGGAIVVLTGSRNDPLGYDVRLELLGTRDSICVGLEPRLPLRSVEPHGVRPRRPYANFLERFDTAYTLQLQAFVEAVQTGAPSPCTGEDARRALAIAEAADRSRREQRSVQLDEVEVDVVVH